MGGIYRDTGREKQSDRETVRCRETHRVGQRESHTDSDGEICGHRQRDSNRETRTERDTDSDRETNRVRQREMHRVGQRGSHID